MLRPRSKTILERPRSYTITGRPRSKTIRGRSSSETNSRRPRSRTIRGSSSKNSGSLKRKQNNSSSSTSSKKTKIKSIRDSIITTAIDKYKKKGRDLNANDIKLINNFIDIKMGAHSNNTLNNELKETIKDEVLDAFAAYSPSFRFSKSFNQSKRRDGKTPRYRLIDIVKRKLEYDNRRINTPMPEISNSNIDKSVKEMILDSLFPEKKINYIILKYTIETLKPVLDDKKYKNVAEISFKINRINTYIFDLKQKKKAKEKDLYDSIFVNKRFYQIIDDSEIDKLIETNIKKNTLSLYESAVTLKNMLLEKLITLVENY